ncbi:MAG: hypothetical protein JWR10_3069, partial [Rubritepida sp.]|nr:hypothetical protein [Rubritepida sp.]
MADPVTLRSERMMGFFDRVFTRTFAGSFSALRVAHWGEPDCPPGTPVIVLERLTSVDGVPTCLWTTYLRREDGLKAAAVTSQGDSYELLEMALG